MHPIHPIVVHFPIALLSVSVAFDALASLWPTGGLRESSLYTLLAGVMSAALAVATGGMEVDLAERAGASKRAWARSRWSYLLRCWGCVSQCSGAGSERSVP